MKHISSRTKKLITLGVVILATVATGSFSQPGRAGNLSDVSVTMSNSRLSFRGEVDTGNSIGSTQLVIESSGQPSNNTNGLVTGDTIGIGASIPTVDNSYAVDGIFNATTIQLDSGLASGDQTAGNFIISNQESEITVKFKPTSFLTDGSVRVLVPAASSANADNIADPEFWDFSTSTPSVTCSGNAVSFGGGSASSNQNIGGNTYHVFSCGYTGTNDGTEIQMVINELINPAPSTGYVAGEAEIYRMIVEHLDSTPTVIDSTQVSVGLIDAVRVTATVSPQISFVLESVPSSASTCGLTTTIATTGTTVPFGELTIAAPSVGSHTMKVSTNAVAGYVVTVQESDQLSRNAKTCTGDGAGDLECIPDVKGDSSDITDTQEGAWSPLTTGNEVYGFGYSLEDITTSPGQSLEFEHTDGWRHFADAENNEDAVAIMANTGPTDNDEAFVCYKVNIPATIVAGNYENHLLYTATATF